MPGPRYSLVRLVAAALRARRQQGARAARLLHHEVGQLLSAAGLELDVVRLDAGEGAAPEIARRLQKVQAHLEKAIEQVRALSYDLNPATVARIGLAAALERLVERYRHRPEPAIRLRPGAVADLPEMAAAALYGIAECALDNAVKHARARRVEISVHPAGESGAALEVRDDGSGFSRAEAARAGVGSGLPLMECYALEAGLELSLDSTPGKGTIVKAVYRPAGAGGPESPP